MDWQREFDSAITVCDKNGIIIYMNEKSMETFASYGGRDLIGKSLFDCHNPNSCAILTEMLKTGGTNTYTIEKNGVKKMIHQAPWYKDSEVMGLVEMSIILPNDMAHHKRD